MELLEDLCPRGLNTPPPPYWGGPSLSETEARGWGTGHFRGAGRVGAGTEGTGFVTQNSGRASLLSSSARPKLPTGWNCGHPHSTGLCQALCFSA